MHNAAPSRRSLLQAIAAAMLAAAVPFDVAQLDDILSAAHPAGHTAAEPAISFLTAAEAADIDAVTAQIIPSDDQPGARDAGVVYFIDRALATFLSQLAADYRAQLAAFQDAYRRAYPGAASFAALTSGQQIAHLKTIDQTPFFNTTRLLTLFGMFSLPAYGGNRGGAGWKLLGFEDAHVFHPPFGHYDRDYPGFTVAPVSVK